MTGAGAKKLGKALLLSVVPLAALAMGVWFFTAPPGFNIDGKGIHQGEGFVPGTVVSYEIMTPAGIIQNGREIADKRGAFKLPALDLSRGAQEDVFSYHLKIETPDVKRDPVDVTFKVDNHKRKVSLQGTGWEQFAAVKLETAHDTLDIKTDWAGILDVPDATELEALENAPVRLAFQGLNFSGETIPGRNAYIEIQALGPQGKGGQCDNTNDGEGCGDVNKYTPTGNNQLSTWDSGEMNARIENAKDNFDKSMEMMGDELAVSSLQDSQFLGSMKDARMQMRLQRKFQEQSARAHATYHPGEELCRFGTFTRSLAASEDKVRKGRNVLNKALIDRYTNTVGSPGAAGVDSDVRASVSEMKSECNKNSAAMGSFCEDGSDGDIDFTSVIDAPLTVDADFTDASSTSGEDKIGKLARNLYWPVTLPPIAESDMEEKGGTYLDQRAAMATSALAHGSFTKLVAAKSAGTGSDAAQGGAYMKSMMRELGIEDKEIHALLGDNPSYYAQMDVMTAKIYQSPGFYTRLYDRPANVLRLGAAMDAVKLMNGRDRFESVMRQEMLASQLLENALKRQQEKANAAILANMRKVKP